MIVSFQDLPFYRGAMIVSFQDLPFYRFTIPNISFYFELRTTNLLILLIHINYIRTASKQTFTLRGR